MNVRGFLENGSVIALGGDKLLVGWGARAWGKSGTFYFPDFFLQDEAPWCRHEEMRVVTRSRLLAELLVEYQPGCSVAWQEAETTAFFNAFHTGLEKVVPYVALKAASRPSVQNCLIHALRHDAGQFLYGFWEKEEGMIGVTPEFLFSLTDSRLETVAVAGTAAPTQNIYDFLHDPKITHEHQIVVDEMKRQLAPFGHVDLSPRELLQLPHLMHLKTALSVTLNQPIPFSDLVQLLHPTPAVGAFPREQGQAWLKAYNTLVPRGRYGAPVGCLFESASFSLVAIRNIQWHANEMTLLAGCGVVPTSDPLDEWKEIQLKLKAIQKTLGLTSMQLAKV